MPTKRTAAGSPVTIRHATPAKRTQSSIFRPVTWDELKTRTAQAIRKRADLVRHKAVGPPRVGMNIARADSGTFFFKDEELPGILLALREHLPQQVERIVQGADYICQHRFRLLGFPGVDYGAEIDWHLDAIHGKRAPKLPWFKVPFLDFAAVGDHKVIWELNRHQHLVTLAKAWTLTRNHKYVSELIRQWHSWHAANPYPIGINWASSLEVAFRSLSWVWVKALLSTCPAFDDNLERELVQHLGRHGYHIEHYISTYFSPNTHLLGEAVALFFIGTLCPQLKRAKYWQEVGLRIILREASRQVRSDGSYFEQSLYYHVYALDFFFHFRQLAHRNEICIPPSFDVTLGKMLGFLGVLSQSGSVEGFGDDDGGRLFDPQRNRSEHLTDPLAVGAMALGRNDLQQRVCLTEETLWLFGDKAASSSWSKCSAGRDLKPSAFEAAGIYSTASSEHCPQQMVIDAGGLGMGRGGHGHADALSVTVSFDRRRWLVDSGTYCYRDAERDRFRGTAAHNTIVVDGLDQAVAEGAFRWKSQPKTQTEAWITGRTFSLFAGSHTGYCGLSDPVLHRRFAFHFCGRFWLVRDIIKGTKEHSIQAFWHFAPDLTVVPEESSFIASPGRYEAGDPVSARMALIFSEDPGWKHEVISHEISNVYGSKVPAPALRMSTRTRLPVEFATAIVPLLSATEKPGTLSRLTVAREPSDRVHAYQYDSAGTAYLMVFSEGWKRWSFGPVVSDAKFLCCASHNESITHLLICRASFATFCGHSIFAASRPVGQFECWKEDGTFRVLNSDQEVAGSFTPPGFEGLRTVHM